MIEDQAPGHGPGVGLLSAHLADPDCAWLVLACDFPRASASEIQQLLSARKPGIRITHFVHADQTPEPLFAIWEPEALVALNKAFSDHHFSPLALLRQMKTEAVIPRSAANLKNINTAAERDYFLAGSLD